jgi:tRNA(fMet)-specific endonuclease VapC
VKSVIVDTDVASFLFKEDTRADIYRPYLAGVVASISFMTLAELEQWAVLRNCGARRHAELLRFITDTFVVIDSSGALCRKWAEIRGQVSRTGYHIDTADAWIAATALLYGAEIVTNNPDDFNHVPGLTVVTEADK